MGGELVGLVEDDQVPPGDTELRLRLLVPGHLVEPDDQLVVVLERLARRGLLEERGIDAELQAELLEQLVPPLLDEAPRGNDKDAAGVGSQDELTDVEPGHDRLAGPGVVGQDEAERLAGEHRLVDGGDLVGQRLDVRGVHRHHGVEQEGEVDPLGLAGSWNAAPSPSKDQGRSSVAVAILSSSARPSSHF